VRQLNFGKKDAMAKAAAEDIKRKREQTEREWALQRALDRDTRRAGISGGTRIMPAFSEDN
jgi:hypothetical protein